MMGSALAFPAKENGNEVRIVGTYLDGDIIKSCIETGKHPKLPYKFPDGIKFFYINELVKAIENCDFVICGVSSFGVDWFKDYVLPILPDGLPIISVTKGLMNTSDGKLISYIDIWNNKLIALNKTNPICAIGGPCTSYELVYHDQTEVTFCGTNVEVLKMIKNALSTNYYHISLSTDVLGVESAVAIKNGYALGIALTIGLNKKKFGEDSEIHYNSQAAVFGQCVKEMKALLTLQGCDDINNLSLGLGDLYVTVYGGRTRLVGILLGEGYNIDEAKEKLSGVTLESLVVAKRVAEAIKTLAKNGKVNLNDFPLLMEIDNIITNKESVNVPWEKFTYENIK